MADARRTENGNKKEEVMINETTMVAEEAAEAMVAEVEEAAVTTITTVITTMVEEVVTMVDTVVVEDIMGTTTSTSQTINTVRPTSNSQRINQHLNLTKSQVDSIISHTTWTAIPTNMAIATVANGTTSNNVHDQLNLVQRASL